MSMGAACKPEPLWIPLITIKARPSTVDAFGQQAIAKTDSASWPTACTTSGYRRNPKWKELQGLQVTSQVEYVLETPWNAVPVSPGMRAIALGVVYEIQAAIDPDMRKTKRNLYVVSVDEAA